MDEDIFAVIPALPWWSPQNEKWTNKDTVVGSSHLFSKKGLKEQNVYMPSKLHMQPLYTKPQMTMYPILHANINNFHQFSITQT
jgi:hypothetical protein